jgi:hypothetical protein
MILADFTCPHHGRFEALAESDADSAPCPCGASSPWSPTAPAVHTAFVVSASRGKSDPAPSKLATDTRPLMEGQRYSEWRKERKKVWREHDHAVRKERG